MKTRLPNRSNCIDYLHIQCDFHVRILCICKSDNRLPALRTNYVMPSDNVQELDY